MSQPIVSSTSASASVASTIPVIPKKKLIIRKRPAKVVDTTITTNAIENTVLEPEMKPEKTEKTEKTENENNVKVPVSLQICDQTVYRPEELRSYDAAFFYGCSQIKNMIHKKGMTEAVDYFFASEKAGVWVISTTEYKRAKLFIKEEWVIVNVPKMMETAPINVYKYEEAPNRLFLKESEMFRDANGNTLDIEVRGEREHNKCFFKVKDVSEMFGMPNLYKTIMDSNSNSNYEIKIHYKYFIISKNEFRKTGEKTSNRILSNSDKHLFLTYKGMLRVLFCSRTGSAELFQDWATERLFTVQMGTRKAKDALASKLIGVNHRAVADVFRCNSSETPCVYLITIGNAKELLKDSKYGDNAILYKFGRTNDLPRRLAEHKATYKNLFGVEISLCKFSIVESRFLSLAETMVKDIFSSHIIAFDKQEELIVLDKIDFKCVEPTYTLIQNNYIGCHRGLESIVQSLKNDIIIRDSVIKMKDLEIAGLMKDNMVEKDSHRKDLEIMGTKHELDLAKFELSFFKSHYQRKI
jgi:prophage antirepressor-like protein